MTEPPLTTKTRPSVGPLPVAKPMPMTAGRRMALVLGVPAALVLMASASLSVAGLPGLSLHISLLDGPQNTYQVTLPPAPVRAGAVTVAIDAGDAQFGPGRPGGDQVAEVTGTARYQGRRPSFTDHFTAAGTSLASSCTGRFPPCSVSYAVAVPTGVALRATDTSGDLTVGHLTGAVTLQDGTGDIDGSALRGPVRISDGSGDVTLGSVFGPAEVSDRLGDVSLRSAAGPVQVSSRSGDITIGTVSGRLQVTDGRGDVFFGPVTGPSVLVRDQSGDVTGQGLDAADVTVTGGLGDISLSFNRAPTRLQVTCSSGDVTLHLPDDGTPYRLITNDTHGSVTVGVPQDAASPDVISVTDGTGDISIGS
jgi:DUF4097 and DUF4098 domain-containing protein YvlB